MRTMLYETFRVWVVAEYQPASDSPLMRALLEGDELHAQQMCIRDRRYGHERFFKCDV